MWQVTLGGKVVRFDDLPPAVFQKIANAYGLHWLDVYGSPAGNLDVWCALVKECAQVLEVDEPDVSTLGAVRGLVNDALARVENDLPKEYEDGLPLVEDDPTTE